MRIARLTALTPLSFRRVVVGLCLLAAFELLTASSPAHAQQSNEKTFAAPGEAALALYNAAKDDDQAALSAIFGNNAGDLLRSGDEVADKKVAQDFLRRYDEMHRVVIEPDGTATLYIGAENWPFPVSIAKNMSGAWYFDAESGKQEVLYRRIGTNENDAIEICYALVEAQRDYACFAQWRDFKTLRNEIPQRPRRTKRAVLEDIWRRARQPHRPSYRGCNIRRLHEQSRSFSRVLFSDSDQARSVKQRWRGELHRGWQTRQRVCFCRVPGAVQKFGCYDFCRQSERHCLPKGPRTRHPIHCICDG